MSNFIELSFDEPNITSVFNLDDIWRFGKLDENGIVFDIGDLINVTPYLKSFINSKSRDEYYNKLILKLNVIQIDE